ncbi:Protein kinase-like domain protein [Diaporthe eres]|nr:Protein kinase-like domain protein [Diaporthe eres]
MIRMLLASPWKDSMPQSTPWIDPNDLPEEFRPSPDYVDTFQQMAHNSPGHPHTSLQLGASFCLDRIDLCIRAAWGSSMNTGFQDVFENYSRSKFTHWSDGTVAINSPFSRIAKHSGILFRAGILSTTTARDLLWEPLKPHESEARDEQTTDGAGKRQYLPSWSWLHNGPISYRETLMTKEKDPEVLASCSIFEDALHSDDRIGSIRATLVLQAPSHPFQRVSLSESHSWDSPSEDGMGTITGNLPTEHRGEMSPLLLDLSHLPTCTSLLRDPFGKSTGWYIPDNGDGSSAGDTVLCCALAMTVSALFKHPKSKRNLKCKAADYAAAMQVLLLRPPPVNMAVNVNQVGFERRMNVVRQVLNDRGLQASQISTLSYDEQYQYPFNNYLFKVELATPALTYSFPGTQPGMCKEPSSGVSVLVVKLSNPAAHDVNNANRVANDVAAQHLVRQSMAEAGLAPLVPDVYAWATAQTTDRPSSPLFCLHT